MRTRAFFMFMVVAAATLPMATPSAAHHSFAAEYDADRPVTLTGSVTKMAWINPHSWIYIDVRKPDGTVENWAVEAAPPGTPNQPPSTQHPPPPPPPPNTNA